jgi:Skp family chaperone for outer membrane proteins
MQQDLQDDVNLERNDILQRSGARMQDVVKKLAESKGLDIVVDTTNAVFYKPAFDLTAEAVTAYNLAYPVK